jgi:hypothetical protein
LERLLSLQHLGILLLSRRNPFLASVVATMGGSNQKKRQRLVSLIRGSTSNSLLPLLAIALHALAPSEAFSTGLQRRPGFSPVFSNQYRAAPSSSLKHFKNFQKSSFSTTCNGPARFFAAPTARTSEEDKANSSEIEVPWECVLDPNCCEECIRYVQHEYGHFHKDEDRVTTGDKVALTAMGAGAFFSFYFLLAFSGPGAWRFFLAGGLCAAASHAVPTPIDVVKV